MLESDFTTLKNITWDTDWVVQSWKVDKEASKGPYGRSTETWNVESNPIKNKEQPDTGLNGEKPGLELWVRTASANDEYIGVGEADSRRSDMLYGSFRAGIEIPAVSGTCAAFFW